MIKYGCECVTCSDPPPPPTCRDPLSIQICSCEISTHCHYQLLLTCDEYDQCTISTHTIIQPTHILNTIQFNQHVGYDDDDDEDYEEDAEEEGNIDRLVQTLVDSMAISIPSKHFVQPGRLTNQ